MGSACNRHAKKTIKIPIRPKVKAPANEEPEIEFPQSQVNGYIGHYFQFQLDPQKAETMKKKQQWTSLIEAKQNEFKNVKTYTQLRESTSRPPPEQQQKIEIVDFMNYVQRDESEAGTPRVVNRPSVPPEKIAAPQVKQSSQEKLLQEIFKDGVCWLKGESEMLLYIFRNQQPKIFAEMLRSGLPFDVRWSAWKIRFHQEESYDYHLYTELLNQVGEDEANTTNAISKDTSRTFPQHPYFQTDDQGNSQGQTQLYRILKALSVQFPKVGYCQGMNFVAGFMLITNGGNDEEAFWLFKRLAESPEFLATGLFEVGFPLTNILMEIFKHELDEKLNQLSNHFKKENIPESLYIFKWFHTLFIYSFPFAAVVRIWDYIFSKNILSMVSLSIAILHNYESKLLTYELLNVAEFLELIRESESILTDTNCAAYMDLEQVIMQAETRFKITAIVGNLQPTSYFQSLIRLVGV